MSYGDGDLRSRQGPRFWGTTVLAGLAVVACVALGAWQFDRARSRDTPTTAGDPMAVAAVPIAEAVPADGRVRLGTQPVAVTLTGRYDNDHQLLVPGREQAGVPAVYVVTPLVRSTGGAVLVVRGWFPGAAPGRAPETLLAPGNDVSVTGWLVPSEPLDAGSLDPLTLPVGQVATVTSARIAGRLPYPILDAYVGLVDDELVVKKGPPPALAAPVTLTPLEIPLIVPSVRWSVQSLFYAVEWWFFGLVVIWMWTQALSIERRRIDPEFGPPDEPQTGDVPSTAPPAPPAA